MIAAPIPNAKHIADTRVFMRQIMTHSFVAYRMAFLHWRRGPPPPLATYSRELRWTHRSLGGGGQPRRELSLMPRLPARHCRRRCCRDRDAELHSSTALPITVRFLRYRLSSRWSSSS